MCDSGLTQYYVMFFERIFLASCSIDHKFLETWKSFKQLLIKTPVDMNAVHNFVSDLYGLELPTKQMHIIYEQPEGNQVLSDSHSNKSFSEGTIELPDKLESGARNNLQWIPSLNLRPLMDCSNIPVKSSRKDSGKEIVSRTSFKDKDEPMKSMRDSIGKVSLKSIISPVRKQNKFGKSRFNQTIITPNERYVRDSESFWEEVEIVDHEFREIESPILLKMKKFELDASITSTRNIFKFERQVTSIS